MLKRQRSEQDGLPDREEGRVGADAERQRQDRDEREGPIAKRGPERVAKVLNKGHHCWRLIAKCWPWRTAIFPMFRHPAWRHVPALGTRPFRNGIRDRCAAL